MSRLGTSTLMDYSRTFPQVDLKNAVKELEESFCIATCGHCGKEFYKTYFVVCAECLMKADRANRGMPEN